MTGSGELESERRGLGVGGGGGGVFSVLRKVTWIPAWQSSCAKFSIGVTRPCAGMGNKSVCLLHLLHCISILMIGIYSFLMQGLIRYVCMAFYMIKKVVALIINLRLCYYCNLLWGKQCINVNNSNTMPELLYSRNLYAFTS